MRMKLSVMLGLLLVLQNITVFAQQSSINFNSPNHAFEGFGGTQTGLVVDPVDMNNTAARFINSGSSWEGAFLDLPFEVVLSAQQIMNLKFHAPSGDTNEVRIKLEEGSEGDVEVSIKSAQAGWSNLSFDFSNATFTGTNISTNAKGSYKRIVIFINGSSSISGTYYIDDISYPNYESANQLDVVYTNLAWAEEFNYFGPIDTSAWFPEVVPPNAWGWFNGEKQHYTDRIDNCYLSNGTLKIVAKRESYTYNGLTLDYTSARLTSKFDFTYGRVDIRAKLPFGDGTWPALWMLGTSIGNSVHPPTIAWPDCGEIDIMEHWGYDQDEIHGSTHTRSSFGSTINTNRVIKDSVSTAFHIYSINWSPNQISFLVDNKLFYTYKPTVKNAATWPFDSPHFFILNIAMGGAWFDIDPSFIESTMEVDYIRVYNNSGIGLEESNKTNDLDLEVYPNPSRGSFKIKGLNSESAAYAEIYTMKGELIIESMKIDNEALFKIELSAGNYILKVYSDSKVFTETISIL